MLPDKISRAAEPAFAHAPWLSVYLDDVEFAGDTFKYLRLVESNGAPGTVVLPLWGESVGMVRQYRIAPAADLWELPRGFGESPEEPVKDAARELREETGLTADTWTDLGSVMPNSGLTAGSVRLWLATVGGRRDLSALDHEIDRFAWWPISRLRAAITADEIQDGFTMAAFLRAELLGLLTGDTSGRTTSGKSNIRHDLGAAPGRTGADQS
ncbi:NUDIX hydrolase [Streptomyces sp. NPDC048566]|uniref:NUDIX hydrolase n=1 Tax=Streptomyces sp. NPDC048566 TaxID=3365569 RepID=UPI00371B8395